MKNYNLSGILFDLLKFREERNWEQFHRPKELVSAINIEVGELMEHFLWRDSEAPEKIIFDKKRFEEIKEEVADVAIYLIFFCHDMEINLYQVIKEKLQKNKEKYPVEKFKGKFE